MNEIVNRLFLNGDKFMTELNLRQSGFTYSACGPFTKHSDSIQNFKEVSDLNYILNNLTN